MTDQKEYADGIYWRMPFEEYLAIPALSSSGIKAMTASPGDFWAQSWMNPKRRNDDTPSLGYGRLAHTVFLEPSEFHMRYVKALDPADFGRNLLTTDPEVKARLKDLGEKQSITIDGKAEKATDRAARLSSIDPDAVIWAHELAKFELLSGDRTVLSIDMFEQISDDLELIMGVDSVADLINNGLPEVVVIWTDNNGVRWKVRIDSLNNAGGVDLKTFANARGDETLSHLASEYRYRKYYIQGALYHEAIQMIPDLPIIGDAPDILRDVKRNLGDHIKKNKHSAMTYLWFQTGGTPNIWIMPVEMYQLPPGMNSATAMAEEQAAEGGHPVEVHAYVQPTKLHQKARLYIEQTSMTFRKYAEFYGTDGAPWLPLYPVSKLTDDWFSEFWLDGDTA